MANVPAFSFSSSLLFDAEGYWPPSRLMRLALRLIPAYTLALVFPPLLPGATGNSFVTVIAKARYRS